MNTDERDDSAGISEPEATTPRMDIFQAMMDGIRGHRLNQRDVFAALSPEEQASQLETGGRQREWRKRNDEANY